MKKICFLCFFCLFLQGGLLAQQETMAMISSTAPGDASAAYTKKWSAFHNPAVLPQVRDIVVSAGYGNRFFMKETSTAGVSVAIPTRYVDVGAAMNFFGYSQYNEIQGGVSLARRFSKYFSMGLSFSYYSVYFSPEEGSKGNIVAQVGLLSEIFPKFFLGFNVFNPAQSKIRVGESVKRIPSVFELGMSYTFGESFLLLAQLDKEIDHPLQWHLGFEYRIIKQLSVSVGGYGMPFVPTLGASLYLQKFALDLNFMRHPSLGISSVCTISYGF